MGFDLFRNASPYWDMRMADAGDLDNLVTFATRGIPIMSGMHNRLLRKVQQITWTDVIEGVSSCEIKFGNLNGEEADHQFFTEGSGAIIYFGYYDFLSFKTTADEVFRGAIKRMITTYGAAGINVTCILNCLGVEIFTKPALPKLVCGEAKTETAALQNLATFCGVQLAHNITDSGVEAQMTTTFQGNGAWMIPAKRKKSNSGGRSKTVSAGEVQVTPMDIVKHLAKLRGAYWNLSDNTLYFGNIPGMPQVDKLFNYRYTHKDMKYIVTHLDYDTFESFEVLDLSSGGLSQGTFAASIDMEAKEIPSAGGDTGTAIPNPINILVKGAKGIFDNEAISNALNKAGKYLGKLTNKVKSELSKFTPSPAMHRGNTISAIAAASAGITAKYKDQTVGGKIKGALGDPHFRAASLFNFTGTVDHTGSYVATKVIQTFQIGTGFKMDIEAVRPKSDILTGNPATQVATKALDRLDNSAKKLVPREIRIQIKQGTDLYTLKVILAAITKAKAAAGGGS